METIYDWLSISAFAGLVVLFLHRSSELDVPRDSLWQYLAAGVGLALANWLGNEGLHWPAIAALVATGGYIHVALRPFRPPPQS
ncbi:XrtV sorting system accessory protein [Sphingosinicella humi]|uniref:Uncharacterized protein n=1 Tax=Allosphingosinicella humi TaxID=2068657 RepID=A0A2U2J567_9SPHN|nr:XrtV sorting system accessory protein [Sphingosinicella humi]PWG03454.1 hypothetical protein DF286_11665 [Sphingosinicella humi]